MGHKTMIDGTAYEVSGGKTMAEGTAYSVSGGRTLVEGTGYDVPFTKFVTVTIVQTVGSLVSESYLSYLTIDGTEYRTSQTLQIPMGSVVTVYAYFGYSVVAGTGAYVGYIKRNDTYKYQASESNYGKFQSYAFYANNDLHIELKTYKASTGSNYGYVLITDL